MRNDSVMSSHSHDGILAPTKLAIRIIGVCSYRGINECPISSPGHGQPGRTTQPEKAQPAWPDTASRPRFWARRLDRARACHFRDLLKGPDSRPDRLYHFWARLGPKNRPDGRAWLGLKNKAWRSCRARACPADVGFCLARREAWPSPAWDMAKYN